MSHLNFVIRVYGLIVNEKNEILLSDEFFHNTAMTKFPGGGLEFGEGPKDCLIRELIEECGQPAEIINHYYTTDFFQKALFFEDAQLVSIYYRARFIDKVHFKISTVPFDFPEKINGAQSFRWLPILNLKQDDVTFPIDKKVVEKIISDPEFSNVNI